MIQGVGEWLLVMLIYFGDGTGITAAKRFPSEEACRSEAAMIAVKAGAVDASHVRYQCAELHGRDPLLVAGETTMDLQSGEMADEDSVPGY